jgi:murein DD-endopeptidase MepM/ murein hydrolase activator NlpD
MRALPLVALLACSCAGQADVNRPSVSSPCTGYPDQATSPYVLPYPVGDTHSVSQGNCRYKSHLPGTQWLYAYDFQMEIGSPVVAARRGTVFRAVSSFPNTTTEPDQENFIMLDHGDGRYSYYSHLDQYGVYVTVGQVVEQGELIGRSGKSGALGEHLHFQVFLGNEMTVPVTFRNTRPHPNGLVEGEFYTALPY